jgi:hypothetical protein
MALADAESLIVDSLEPTFDPSDGTSTGYAGYSHYPYQNITRNASWLGMDLGCGTGVQMLQGDYDVPIQQVTSDAQLNTSLVKFRTDGSPVLIVYENGCCIADTVRSGRDGNRSILNAFRLDFVRPAGYGPIEPCPDTVTELKPSFRWWPSGSGDTVSYDLYFGTNPDWVQDAGRSSNLYIGNVSVEMESYDPPGDLDYFKTYYWRADSIDAAGNVIMKGPLWSFTVKRCLALDDFERPYRYGLSDHHYELYKWEGGGGTEEYLRLWVEPASYDLPKWLQFDYLNLGIYGYSETIGSLIRPQDWLGEGLGFFNLKFKGRPTNQPDRLYVAVEDASGNTAEVAYGGDLNNLQDDQWHSWAFNVDQFAGADLGNVRRIYIGVGQKGGAASGAVGVLDVDDIAICRGRCQAGGGPSQDLDGDCIVDFFDHAAKAQGFAGTPAAWQDYKLLAEQWLEEILVW